MGGKPRPLDPRSSHTEGFWAREKATLQTFMIDPCNGSGEGLRVRRGLRHPHLQAGGHRNWTFHMHTHARTHTLTHTHTPFVVLSPPPAVPKADFQ